MDASLDNRFVKRDGYVELVIRCPLNHTSDSVILDASDVERVKTRQWVVYEGVVKVYKPMPYDRFTTLVRFLLKTRKGQYAAVLNGDELDCRRSNLRVVSEDELYALEAIQAELQHRRYALSEDDRRFVATMSWNESSLASSARKTPLDAMVELSAMESAYIADRLDQAPPPPDSADE